MPAHPAADARRLREKARADYLDAERDLFLRWGPTAARHLDDDRRRLLARLGHAVGWKRLASVARIATVGTIRRWHRTLLGARRERAGGKPQTPTAVEALVVKLALALENNYGNDSWGRRRIAGELQKLGHKLDPGTVRHILRRHGVPPAPKRGRGRDQEVAVVADKPADVELDFVQTVILDSERVCRAYVLLAIHTVSRKAAVVGITEQPGPVPDMTKPVIRVDRLGGAIHHYERVA